MVLSVAALLALLGYALLLDRDLRRQRSTARRPSLRVILVTGLCLLATVPMVSLVLVLAERTARAQDDATATRLQSTAAAIAVSADQFVDKHLTGVVEISHSLELFGSADSTTLLRHLELSHAIYTDFLTMLVTDATGTVIEATRLENGHPHRVPFGGHDVSDRGYYREPMASGAPYVSEVFQGRGLGRDPIVAVSAPYSLDGAAWSGVVEGSLNLGAFERLQLLFPVGEYDLLVVDQSRRVLYSTLGAEFPVLSALEQDVFLGSGSAAEDTLSSGGIALAEHFVVARAPTRLGWSVWLRAPRQTFMGRMMRDYAPALAWLAAAVVISLMLARSLVRRVNRPLRRLARAVEAVRLGDGGQRVEVLPQTPVEVAAVFDSLAELERRLADAYAELTASMDAEQAARSRLAEALADRESVIEARTRDLEAARQQLEKLAQTDPLTGLKNRRAFGEARDLMWRVAMRSGDAVTLAVVDVDHFKSYNDRYGHAQGDACLVAVAQALTASAGRPLDSVARYGGEEFVLLLGSCDGAGGRVVAERCRQAVEALELVNDAAPAGLVTVSIGVASGRPCDGTHFDELFERADSALYAAKSAGRNQVRLAAPPSGSAAATTGA